MDRQESHTSSPGWLSQVTRKVELRWRLERGKSALASGIAILAVLEGVWAVLASFKRSWIAPFPYGAAAGCATLLLIALHAWLRRVDPKMLLRGIDRRLHLPDTVLSAGELAGQDAWVEHLRTESLAQTLSADWSRVWPAPWPKWSGYSSIGCVAFLALLTYFYSSEMTSRRALMSRPVPRDPRVVALETLFKDWDQAKEQDEALKKMMEQIAPLQQRLTAPQASEKQRLLDIGRLEEIVASEKAKLDAQSLETHAAKLADALQPMEGMSALAAALRKKDFDKAAEQAQQMSEKLGADKAEVPKGASEAGNATQKVGEQLAKNGQQQMSQSLSQFSQGAKQGDLKQMSSALSGMKQGFSKESSSNSERKRLSAQLAQLSFSKNPGEGKNPGMNFMPMLSLMKQKEPGKGAGSETDLNRFGAPTDLASERHAESMNNMASDGESETTTLKSAEGQSEAKRATRTVGFQEYQQLSQQAIADESIPAAHREAIKQYFEKIRPDPGK